MFTQSLADIRAVYEGGASRTGSLGSIQKEDVLLWSKESGRSLASTFDKVGVDLARSYASGTLDWNFCDFAANQLHHVMISLFVDDAIDVDAKQFRKFYLAFDNSECFEAVKSGEVALAGIRQLLKEIPSGV